MNKIKIKIKKKKKKNHFILINFISSYLKIYYPIACKKTDLISRLEEKISEKYEEYKKYNIDLYLNGKSIKRFKTVEENGIKSGDIILFAPIL